MCFLPLSSQNTPTTDAAASDARTDAHVLKQRLFQSTLDATATARSAEDALLKCQAKRVTLQVQIAPALCLTYLQHNVVLEGVGLRCVQHVAAQIRFCQCRCGDAQ